MIKLPIISDCSAKSCAFNHDGCSAAAVTIGNDGCATYIESDVRGGIDEQGQVGACKRTDCKHNDHLECSAHAIEVGSDSASCLTYQAA